jgi:Mn-dependent DtxR family transcriptional regulator
MLGVRRPGVTETAVKLKELGLIDYSRGHIEMTELKAQENMSCECYIVLKDEYDRLLGIKPSSKEVP